MNFSMGGHGHAIDVEWRCDGDVTEMRQSIDELFDRRSTELRPSTSDSRRPQQTWATQGNAPVSFFLGIFWAKPCAATRGHQGQREATGANGDQKDSWWAPPGPIDKNHSLVTKQEEKQRETTGDNGCLPTGQVPCHKIRGRVAPYPSVRRDI